MRRTGTILLAVALAGAISIGAADTRSPLDWDHPDLELYLWAVGEASGRVELRFCLQLRTQADRAWTRVGFPRYRTPSGNWNDAVIRSSAGRERVVALTRGHADLAMFSVIVPPSATRLALPIGDDTVRLEARDWTRAARQAAPDVPRPAPMATMTTVEPEAAPALPPPSAPVRLQSDLRWEGSKPFGDGALDAGERGDLVVEVLNHGQRPAHGLQVRIVPADIPGVRFPSMIDVAAIEPGGWAIVRVPFIADDELPDASRDLSVEVVEPYGHDAAPIGFELTTRSAAAAELVLTEDFVVDGSELPVPRDRVVTVRLRVRNVGQGAARDVVATIEPGEGVFPAADGGSRFELGDLAPGEVAELAYRCFANQRAKKLDLHVVMADARTPNAPSRALTSLPLDDDRAVARIVRVRPDPRDAIAIAPAPPPLVSDVDRFVPESITVRPDALAVVIGVEDYRTAPPAEFAADDARTASRYFRHGLGIPPENIQVLLDGDVTLAQMHRIFGEDGWLARRASDTTELFVFYAGHGLTEPERFVPYLFPSDGDLNYVRHTAYSLDAMIDSIAALGVRRATVFLDACFSGLGRSGQALTSGARPLVVAPTRRMVSGIALFSAAQGGQFAHSMDSQGHGLFSYFLFRGLGGAADLDADGAVTAGELKFFLEDRVPAEAALRDREQSPAIILDSPDHVLLRLR